MSRILLDLSLYSPVWRCNRLAGSQSRGLPEPWATVGLPVGPPRERREGTARRVPSRGVVLAMSNCVVGTDSEVPCASWASIWDFLTAVNRADRLL